MFVFGAILGILVLALLIWFVVKLIDLDDLYDTEKDNLDIIVTNRSWDDDEDDDMDTDPGVSYSASDKNENSSGDGYGGGDSGGGGASSDW